MKQAAARVAMLGVTVLAAGLMGPGVAAADPGEGTVLNANAASAIKDSYIVVFKPNTVESRTVDAAAARLSRSYGGSVRHAYKSTVKGFSARLTEQAAKRLAANPAVAYVEQDLTVKVNGAQFNPSWGLDRIDQAALPLSGTYSYPNTASNVHAYIIDSGIRITHTDFGGRASNGWDFINNDPVADDCRGHGTHVAGTVGGNTYGVAKGVQLVAVKVLGCDGSGSSSAIVAGVDWVTSNAVKPAVANMSLGTNGVINSAIDSAVQASIASGVTYAVSAGNSNADACTTSPADVPEAITVGATDLTAGTTGYVDTRATFSNYGTCLDIFAPGVDIESAYNGNDSDFTWMQGTSMASPHVAGAAALYLSANPTATPAQVTSALLADATANVVGDAGTGSPNRLLHIAPPPASTYKPTPPARVLDTRNGTGASRTTPLAPGETLQLNVADAIGVPATDVTAVVLNVTVTQPSVRGYLTVYPDGQPRPAASNLNFLAGQTIPNLVTVPVVNGTVDFYNPGGTVHVVADLFGYYTTAVGSKYNPAGPVRVLDTRNRIGAPRTTPLAPGEVLKLKITDAYGVPATDVTAVVLNVTVTQPSARGYLTVYPDGQAQPTASNLNFLAGQTIPNLVTVPVTNGYVDFYNPPGGTVHVVADLFGYYTTGTGSVYTPTTPVRVMDSRNGTGGFTGPLGPNEYVSMPVGDVTAVVLNVTVTQPSARGYLTVYPDGQAQPTASNLNFLAGQTIPNLVVVPVVNGWVNFYNPGGTVHLVVDLFGYYTP